jgi:hypothetical protein
VNRIDQETEKEARAHKGCRAIHEEEEDLIAWCLITTPPYVITAWWLITSLPYVTIEWYLIN